MGFRNTNRLNFCKLFLKTFLCKLLHWKWYFAAFYDLDKFVLIKCHICAWETRADGIHVNCSLKHSCTNCCIVPIYTRIVLWLIHETKVKHICIKCLYKCSFVNCIECDRFLRILWTTCTICSASFIHKTQKYEHNFFFITRNCKKVFTHIFVKCDHIGICFND